jgi:hypothetical protein
MDPMIASSLIGGASNVLGHAMSTPPAGPSTAIGSSNGQGGASGGGLDFSGMTVALNGSTANGAAHPTTSGFAITPITLLIGGVIAIAMIRAWKR